MSAQEQMGFPVCQQGAQSNLKAWLPLSHQSHRFVSFSDLLKL